MTVADTKNVKNLRPARKNESSGERVTVMQKGRKRVVAVCKSRGKS
ncbi:MAG: hypothetical protein L6V93_22230 [Clostridiales bacterium]|nr:MAG: hypothetical protein L6V93_22230 [Clostridiales bacterium]